MDLKSWMKGSHSQEGRTFNASVYSQKDWPGLDILLFVAEEAPIVFFVCMFMHEWNMSRWHLLVCCWSALISVMQDRFLSLGNKT